MTTAKIPATHWMILAFLSTGASKRNIPRDPATFLQIMEKPIPISPSCLNYLVSELNDSAITIAAGPSVTRNSAGKMKSTSGNTSFTEVLLASSSTI